ncbi:hypothetical protein CXB51_030407 [Gossypium anomalum]|uniref:IBB domain-containing protein n=1 Tax=Gossypium anomalum TaxID=47600 RepID=A0A8J6CRU6_9ROSI|nr:hypothetical protein CXB51_030407 [Gossypium anomalum]
MSLRPSARTEVRRNRYKVALMRRKVAGGEKTTWSRSEKTREKRTFLKNAAKDFSLNSSNRSNSNCSLQPLLESLPAMVAGVWSDDRNMQLEATTQFRKLLSIGVVPRFVEFLNRDDFPQLQFEAAWALTNIASGTSDNTRVVIDHGAAVWALGNVAGDSPKCRDLVLGHGALVPLLAQFNEHAKLSMLRNATWTLSNFCRGKPQPSFEQTKPALPALERLIHSNDEEVLTDACWALSYLSDGTNDKIQAVIEAGVCPRLAPIPNSPHPALRTVGNIVTGDDMQTQCIIGHQALPCLLNLLTNTYKKSIKKEACWTISNITAGNVDQIQAVIEAGIIAPLVHLLQNAEFEIKKEAAWAISMLASGGTHEQIKYIFFAITILWVGEAEKNLGHTGDVNLYAQLIDDAEGLEKIENLPKS